MKKNFFTRLFYAGTILISLFLVSCSNSTKISPLNQNAKNNKISGENGSYMFYSFGKKFFSENQNALELTFGAVKNPTEITVAFLYDTDFKGKKLISSLPSRNTCTILLSDDCDQSKISFAFLPEIKDTIKGFLVYSVGDLSLENATGTKAALGFDKNYQNPTSKEENQENTVFWYGFGPNGGIIYSENPSFIDFSEAKALAFSSEEAKYQIGFRDNNEDLGELGFQNKVKISFGDTVLSIRRSPNQADVNLYQNRFQNQLGKITIRENSEMIESFVCYFQEKSSDFEPILVDPYLIIDWSPETWRNPNFEVYAWEQFPNILIFDTLNYAVQDDLLKRIAFFTEKEGFRGRLAADEEIKDLHGFNAHDYRSETLAAFFDLAEKENFPLNQMEKDLRSLLEDAKIIIKTETGYEKGEGAIISISQESPRYLRSQFIAHEGAHGIYFVDEEFRNLVDVIYDIIDTKSLEFLQGFFASQPSLGYDPNDPYLMRNELMAYLLQQSVAAIPGYFAENLAWRGTVNNAIPELAKYVRDTKAQGFVDAANVLEGFLFSKYGLAAGRVSLTSVE